MRITTKTEIPVKCDPGTDSVEGIAQAIRDLQVYDIVVIVLTSSAYIMLQRNLLYTAVTRAKEKCIIVGDRKAIETIVANWRLRPRYTRLKERLKE